MCHADMTQWSIDQGWMPGNCSIQSLFPSVLAIPEIAIRDGIKRSDAVTCRHLRHFGNFRGAGFGLAPTGLGLAPTGRRLPEGSGGQGTRIPTPRDP